LLPTLGPWCDTPGSTVTAPPVPQDANLGDLAELPLKRLVELGLPTPNDHDVLTPRGGPSDDDAPYPDCPLAPAPKEAFQERVA
jgi:hypothetical protein